MKIISIRKKTIFKISSAILFVMVICIFTQSFGMQHYYKVDFSTGLVTATILNVRSGPGVNYNIVATVKKNEYIRVFAGVGDWYIVQVEGDYVGAVSKKYVKAIYPNSSGGTTSGSTSSGSSSSGNTTNTSTMSSDEKEVFDLINKQRTNNGLTALKMDSEVLNVARIKAKDMVDNNYFSHNSQTYGSPFDMMKQFGISYRTAGENIAKGQKTPQEVVTAWMNSEGHRKNILNPNFTNLGVGIAKDSKGTTYWTQMFIGK